MIFPVWQPIGGSSHQLAQQCGELLHQKTSHTGTLDPLAEGVVVVLSGEDRLVKGSLSDWKKEYQFFILWGLQTDSGDRLGLITGTDWEKPLVSNIQKIITTFPRSYLQTVPAFSARRWQGKSAFEWARQKQELPLKKRLVQLQNLRMLNSFSISQQEVLQEHAATIATITGDFRQQAITASWQESLFHTNTDLLLTQHQVTTSAGTYIRQLVQDLASQLKIPATTWSITRTTNGPFEREDCIEITELAEL